MIILETLLKHNFKNKNHYKKLPFIKNNEILVEKTSKVQNNNYSQFIEAI